MWKIQLTMASNIISSIDEDEEHVMHSKSDKKEIMINNLADEVIKKLFDSHKNRYQNNLESIKVVALSSIMFIYWVINAIK